MFAYTGLPADAVKEIIREHHVYLSADARISIAGMNSSNIEYVAWAFNEVSKNI
jgi:aspartate/tyrosine/aromatic aminotransferase